MIGPVHAQKGIAELLAGGALGSPHCSWDSQPKRWGYRPTTSCPQLAAINEHVEADAGGFTIALENGRVNPSARRSGSALERLTTNSVGEPQRSNAAGWIQLGGANQTTHPVVVESFRTLTAQLAQQRSQRPLCRLSSLPSGAETPPLVTAHGQGGCHQQRFNTGAGLSAAP